LGPVPFPTLLGSASICWKNTPKLAIMNPENSQSAASSDAGSAARPAQRAEPTQEITQTAPVASFTDNRAAAEQQPFQRKYNVNTNTYTEETGRYTYIRNVCLTRKGRNQSFGLQLHSLDEKTRGSNVGCGVKKIMEYVSAPPGLIQQGDVVVSINGQDSSKWTYEKTVKEIRSMTALTLLLSLRRDRPKAATKTKRSDCMSSNSNAVAASSDEAYTASTAAYPAEAALPTTGAFASAKPAAECTKLPNTEHAAKRTGDAKDRNDASETTTTHPPSVTNPAKRENGATSKNIINMPEDAAGPEEGGGMSYSERDTKVKDDAKPAKKKRKMMKKRRKKEEDNAFIPKSDSPDPVFVEYSAPPVGSVESAFINAIKKQASNNLEPPPQDEDGPQLRFIFISIPKEEGKVLAEIILNDMKVGSICAQYIKREANFCEKCERIGGDLEEVAGEIFEEGGKIHCNDLKSFDSCWQGPDDCYFLYIHRIDVQEEFESSEKRSDVISSLLKLFLTDKRMKKWKIVAYRANDNPQPGEHPFVEPSDGLLPFFVENQEEYAENKWTAWETERRECIGSDSRPFLRVGFQELSKESTEEMGFLYVTKKMFSQIGNDRMSFAKAAQIKLRCDDPPDVEQYRKEKLQFELLATILEEDCQLGSENHKPQCDDSSIVERVLPRIDELIAKGADVGESKALHAAAYQFFSGLFSPLLDRGGELDSRDKNSMTPLMIVGSNVYKRIENDSVRSLLAISSLIAMGADKNLRDRAGRTALGHYYQTMKDLNDLERSQLGVPETPIDRALERALMPEGGPTEADQRARDGA